MDSPEVFNHQGAQVSGDAMVLFAAEPVVGLSCDRAEFLDAAATRGLTPVLASGPDSALSEAMRDYLALAGGRWVVKDAAGLYDGSTGAPLQSWDDNVSQPLPQADGYRRPASVDAMRLVISFAQRHKADASTVLGGMLEGFLTGLGLGHPGGWGSCEPVDEQWDRTAMTGHLRARMPDSSKVVVAGCDPAVSAVIQAQRTSTGVEEIVTGLVSVGPIGEPITQQRIESVAEALAELCTGTMPLFGLVMAHAGRADLAWEPRLPDVPTPVALLIGPPSVKELRLDVTEETERWSAIQAGRPKLPALVYPLAGSDNPAARFLELATRLEQASVAAGPRGDSVRQRSPFPT
ncbi:MAG: DUF6177 family protein [Propionibacteriaceae bacterium]|nr:DUF6177 family protein [Propionibacteriaceae bacterium]